MLLDTHALVWLDEANPRLGKSALSTIDLSLKSKSLYVSSISFWEIAMLIEKNRLEISMSVDLWRKSLLDNGLQEIPLTGNIAIQSALLNDFHGDPADRMIVATAMQATAKLCTADRKILAWTGKLQWLDAGV